ncbi:MAG TPA: O-antigen ligase family protein [Planctomycetaceae bacterium]|nr:O-antigen ligase family protein [Planctomycetaceae bacterium]
MSSAAAALERPLTSQRADSIVRSLVQGSALFLFALAHMQDIETLLCPVSLFLVIIAFLPDISLYRYKPSVFLPVLLWAVYIPCLCLIHGNFGDGSWPDVFRRGGRIIYTLSIFVVFAHIRPHVRVERLVMFASMLAASLVATACLFSFFVHPIVIGEASLSTPNFITGLMGPTGKNPMAAVMGTILVLATADWLHAFEHRELRKLPWLAPLLALPVLVTFVFCKSRTWVLAFAIVGAIAAFRAMRRDVRIRSFIILGGIAVVLAGTVASIDRKRQPEGTESTEFRLVMWNRALHYIIDSPLLGIGIGTFEQKHVHLQTIVPNLITIRTAGEFQERCQSQNDPNGGMNVHNGYLNTWTDFGIVGLALYGWLVWELIGTIRTVLSSRLRRERSLRAQWSSATWAATVASLTLIYMCVGALAEGYVFYGPNSPMFLVIAFGRLVALRQTFAAQA